jgi:hypothetical protein
MATRYGKTFRTRKGKLGRYKYVNGRRVAFVTKFGGYQTRTRWKRKFRGSHRR